MGSGLAIGGGLLRIGSRSQLSSFTSTASGEIPISFLPDRILLLSNVKPFEELEGCLPVYVAADPIVTVPPQTALITVNIVRPGYATVPEKITGKLTCARSQLPRSPLLR